MAAEYPTLAEVVAKHADSWIEGMSYLHLGISRPACRSCTCGRWVDDSPLAQFSRTSFSEHVQEVWREACTITTPEQLDALPPEVIVKSEGGTVACRYYDRVHGVTFGDERPFTWTVLASELPAVVLWHPSWGA